MEGLRVSLPWGLSRGGPFDPPQRLVLLQHERGHEDLPVGHLDRDLVGSHSQLLCAQVVDPMWI